MIYLDNAATTPPEPSVLETYTKVYESFWANPHSLHKIGERAEQLLEQARSQVTTLLDGAGYRAIFTSGATESNNLAIRGVAEMYRSRGNHLITTNSEHPSVANVMEYLEQRGFRITRLPVGADGAVTVEQVREVLTDDTILVSIMMVNNESGAINPIRELAQLLKNHRALFHVDAVQGVGKIPFSLQECPVDFLSLSAHKFFGLKGSGTLILRERQIIQSQMIGGGQEFDLRSGTADVPRAAAFAKALRLATENLPVQHAEVTRLNQIIHQRLNGIDGVIINSPETGSPYILNCSVAGIRPETILHGLVKKEIYISTVSACSSKKTELSPIILAMTGDEDRAAHAIRISLSSKTTESEIIQFLDQFESTIAELR